MKRTLSLILALLLLASSMTSCGNGTAKETEKRGDTTVTETNPPATEAPVTDAPDTQAPETEAPAPVYPYDTSLITENGVAKAHIVLPDGASGDEKKAAEELAFHINLVTGAEISTVNAAQSDSLPIIIATPDTLPELETLFPEDLEWLRATGKVGDMERYGDDGFAIRTHEGKIYIFGAVPRGALNGTYDFIEENLDLIWVRNDDSGIIYDEMPTVNVIKTDYREKSPFQIRYNGGTVRNKYESVSRPYGGIHTVKSQVLSSPIYDPNNKEYWETNLDGQHYDASTSNQVNFWSQLTADTVAATVIAQLDAYDDASRPKYINVCEEDFGWTCGVYPEQTLPFEYEPGQFVNPDDEAYFSTVYYTFINRVARKVAEKYPDVSINTLIYDMGAKVPVCDIDDNVSLWFCPTAEDYTQPSFATALEKSQANGFVSSAARQVMEYEKWVAKHPNIMLYTYYFTQMAVGWYERPIWYRIQDDFQYYAKTGNLGCRVEVQVEGSDALYGLNTQDGGITKSMFQYTNDDGRRMNLLSYWLYQKLLWDPYEDVDALIVKFCDKVYGAASPYMQEYYDILYKGWQEGAEIIDTEFNAAISWGRDQEYYFNYFIGIETADGVYVLDALVEALNKAWEAADDRAKEFIRQPYERYQDWVEYFGY